MRKYEYFETYSVKMYINIYSTGFLHLPLTHFKKNDL